MTGDDLARLFIIGAAAVTVLVGAACGLLIVKQKLSGRRRRRRDRKAWGEQEMRKLRADLDAWNRGVRP